MPSLPGRINSEQHLRGKDPVGPGGQQVEREPAEPSSIPGWTNRSTESTLRDVIIRSAVVRPCLEDWVPRYKKDMDKLE